MAKRQGHRIYYLEVIKFMGLSVYIKGTGEWRDRFQSKCPLLDWVLSIPIDLIQRDGTLNYTILNKCGVEQASVELDKKSVYKQLLDLFGNPNFLGIYGYGNFGGVICACYISSIGEGIEIELLSGYPMLALDLPDMNWIVSVWVPLLNRAMMVESLIITLVR